VAFVTEPSPSQVPVACTLHSEAVPGRLADWQGVVDNARDRIEIDGGIRLDLGQTSDVGELAQLVAEQQCCAFLAFAITFDACGVGLEVRAPKDALELVDAVFGGAS
jgi:hypothetical protein